MRAAKYGRIIGYHKSKSINIASEKFKPIAYSIFSFFLFAIIMAILNRYIGITINKINDLHQEYKMEKKDSKDDFLY